jgi:hypothetical protein
MTATALKKTILLSIACHAALFFAFSVSFGKKLPVTQHAAISFLGQLLDKEEITAKPAPQKMPKGAGSYALRAALQGSPSGLENSQFLKQYFLDTPVKPNFTLETALRKSPASAPFFGEGIVKNKREQVIMFYPHLPYHFLLYFKDRQTAHIELSFQSASASRPRSLTLKRKVSSGNLEADLLSMRYIGHYLFVQRPGVLPDKGQTVKIDLSSHADK